MAEEVLARASEGAGRVLVTGGAGFIGSHLVEALLRRGERVRVLDDLSTGSLSNIAACHGDERLEVEIGTARDAATFRRVLDGCGTVFHLAASVGVGMVTAEPAECLRNNVEGVQNLLAGLAGLPGRLTLPRVILFSSSEVYGKSERVPLREDGDLVLGPSNVPRWSYASGKVTGEFLVLAEHRRTGLPATVVRCFNTCGPRQQPTYGMVVPRLLGQALRGEPLTVFGDGRQSRCFSFVDDVVAAVLALACRPETVGEVYNVGSDHETTVLELASRVRRVTGSASPVHLVPYHEAYGDHFEDVRRRVPDLGKIRGVLGPLLLTDLDTLLRLTLSHLVATGAAAVSASSFATAAAAPVTDPFSATANGTPVIPAVPAPFGAGRPAS
jgi:UDP-glucose 4-epimerase